MEGRQGQGLPRQAFPDPETGKRRFVSKGVRSPKTEALRERFIRLKAEVEARQVRQEERLRAAAASAKALRLGRAPVVVGEVLRALSKSPLSEHFVLSGSLALLAYETQALAAVPIEVLGFKPDIDLFVRDERDVAIVESVLASVDSGFRREGHGARRFAGPVAIDYFTLAEFP